MLGYPSFMSELRPSFEERDRYLRLLGVHYADGRLDDAEFERRSDAVLAAVTHRDAMIQFEGLPTPNIVPVNPQPRPDPRYQPSPPRNVPAPVPPETGVDRRIILVAGGIGLGVVGLIAWANAVGPNPGNDETWVEEPMGSMMAEPQFDGDLIGGAWTVVGAMQERGLDHFSAFQISGGVIRGSALALRAPGVVTAFEFVPGQVAPEVLHVGEDEQAINSVPLEQLGDAVQQTYDRAQSELLLGDLAHQSLDLTVSWRAGSPVYRWSMVEGDGYAVFKSMLDLIELKR